MAEKKKKGMEWSEVQRIVKGEIDSAMQNRSAQSERRTKAWDRYYGRKLGNEKKGRSQFITRDVMDTIEWMMPYFMKTFFSGDPKIEIDIEGQDPAVGKALMDRIQMDLAKNTPTQFVVGYQWVKDALVSNTAYTKMGWDLDQEVKTVDFENVSQQNIVVLLTDPDIQVQEIKEDQTAPFQLPTYTVTAKVNRTIKDQPYVENTPNWEFIASSKARDIDDEHGKGHQTEVTLDYLKRINRAFSKEKEPYFKGLDQLEEEGQGIAKHASVDTLEGEKASYEGEDQKQAGLDETAEGPKKPIKFIEWYTRLDVNQDGYLENVICYMGDDNLLRWEINEEDIIPFSALKPIIDCYKFEGISYAELLIEIQNLKTMLFRRILDNFDFQNSGRWRVDPDGQVDLYALYNNVPGGAFYGKKDSVEDLSPSPWDPRSFTIIEYVDSLRENRSGVTRYNQGMDSGSLNKTATGIVQIQTAAMQRMELVGRIFAETGLRNFYYKLARLYQRYLRKPFTAKIHGKEMQISPETIQGKIVCTVNMGVEASVGMEEATKIERMLAILFKVNQMFPGLLTPEKVHNISRRYVTSIGFKNADNFINDLESFLQQGKQSGEMQKRLMEMQQRMEQMELAIKKQEADTKAQKVQTDAALKDKDITLDFKSDMAGVQQRDRDSMRDFKVDMLSLLANKENEGGQSQATRS